MKIILDKQKRGFTLIEVMVACVIFVIVITLALGAFLSINRSRIYMAAMKETEQRIRVVSEMLSRLSKESEYVVVKDEGGNLPVPNISDGGYEGAILEMFFDLKSSNLAGKKFEITDDKKILYYECQNPSVNIKINNTISSFPVSCSDWGIGENVLAITDYESVFIDNDSSYFKKFSNTIPAKLSICLEIRNVLPDKSLTDEMTIVSTYILKGVE